MKMRKFEFCTGFEKIATIPMRGTRNSAGYDFYNLDKDIVIPPHQAVLVKTGIKAIMPPDEVLLLYIRSSLAAKRHLILSNGVGVIDADYANNPDNEGNIMLSIMNLSDTDAFIEAHERVAQGIFTKFQITDDDSATGNRTGGIGSTGKN